jgi:hypothetical protein
VRRLVGAGVLAGVALLASACGGQQAGSAATLGDSRISEVELTQVVQEILAAQGKPVDSADEVLTADTLARMIVIDLVDVLAAREGVEVSQGAIDEELTSYINQVGGEDAMVNTFVQQGVAPSQIDDVIRLSLTAEQLGVALAPDAPLEEQGQIVFEAAIALSQELEVAVSPRYGSWDPLALSLGPTPNDLAAPPALLQ